MSAADSDAASELDLRDTVTNDAIDGLTALQRRRLRDYWLDRASGELTTALTFEFMLDDLTREGLPGEVLELASVAIADEHRHADWCLRWAERLDDAPAAASLGGTRPLCFDGASEHDDR